MVFRRRFTNSLRPINRIKHVVDIQNATAAGAQVNEILINTVDNPVISSPKDVQTGSKVNGIFLVVEVVATTSAALSNVYLVIFKNPGGNLSNPVANTVEILDDKRFSIHQEMIMLQRQTNSNPRTLFKGVIMLPRGYRRMGPNDILTASILAPGVNIDYCIQVHYKEFR